MALIKLRFVTTDVDANGNVRYYFRRPRQRKIRLRGVPGSEDFMKAYQAALTGSLKAPPRPTSVKAPLGSFRAVCAAYYASPKFRALDDSTKAWQRRALDGIAQDKGDLPIARLEPRPVRQLRDAKAETPAAANTLLKALRALFAWALEYELVPSNPTRDVIAPPMACARPQQPVWLNVARQPTKPWQSQATEPWKKSSATPGRRVRQALRIGQWRSLRGAKPEQPLSQF